METEGSRNVYFDRTIGGNRYSEGSLISVFKQATQYTLTGDTDVLYIEY